VGAKPIFRPLYRAYGGIGEKPRIKGKISAQTRRPSLILWDFTRFFAFLPPKTAF